MLQSLRTSWRRKQLGRAHEASTELVSVLDELRNLRQQTSLEEFQASPMVKELKHDKQFYNLGTIIYNNANKDPVEVQKALFLWRQAMKMGSVAAKYSVAMCLKEGVGVKDRDVAMAIKHFQELAELGHPWSMFGYAQALSTGECVRQDTKKAFQWFYKAATLNVPPAYGSVANMYLTGTGVALNVSEGIKWLEKASESGDPNAKARLGEHYYHGKGVVKDVPKAIALYKQAAVRGVVHAQFNLGVIYLNGEDVPQDYLQAEALFRLAAEKGFVMSMVNLAQMYWKGCGDVPKNIDLAKQWLTLAAPHDTHAKAMLDEILTNEVEETNICT